MKANSTGSCMEGELTDAFCSQTFPAAPTITYYLNGWVGLVGVPSIVQGSWEDGIQLLLSKTRIESNLLFLFWSMVKDHNNNAANPTILWTLTRHKLLKQHTPKIVHFHCTFKDRICRAIVLYDVILNMNPFLESVLKQWWSKFYLFSIYNDILICFPW